jgi:26S proteasome regulatory subunit T4
MRGQLSDGFNGADLRNVVTESGMFAIRDDRYVNSPDVEGWASYHPHREYIKQEDLTKAARKVGEAKKHESLSLPR